MAANLEWCDSDVEEDYIDMEVTSFTNLVRKALNNNTNNNNPREFEFQMSHICPLEIDKTSSPADELFYKGKLLPLHLPPRLQMVQKLLEDYTFDEEFYSTPLATGTVNTPVTSNTPFESCTVSPADSCQVSRELNPKDYFLEYSSSLEDDEKKKSWGKKLRMVKHLSFGTKIKASRAYLRSFFGKSSCSDESRVADEGSMLRCSRAEKPKKQSNGSVPRSHRRSFSVSMRRQPAKSLNNKSSTNLGFRPLQFLKRSTSSNSEVENSIQGAILHCKQSQQQKQYSVNEVGFCSLSASKIAGAYDQERAQMFRG
ncbi:putative membrane-associated kinase regulator 4 [Raphanus sativus]|uniref:Probable membrane-associated kinase regulator 4 n=1 Tax=Raphanus sativus TaxID=3726 RepID=A0A6J0ND88_RAPSA|nr:probable membrane-associated kinase regulator 4 [Raphanus sativus]KAJ4903902.1 putative membrane-associated kinase regulator 4 [Raphanus sativus]